MSAADDDQALEALLASARGVYPFGLRFHLASEVVVAFVRACLIVRPDLTVAELLDYAGQAGIPTSLLVRAGRQKPPAPVTPTGPTRWTKRVQIMAQEG